MVTSTKARGDRKARGLLEPPQAIITAQRKPATLRLIGGRHPRSIGCRSDQRLARLPALLFLARKRLGLNLTAFGKLIGVTSARVGEFETGRRMPNLAHLEKLAELMHLSPEALRILSIALIVDAIFRSGTSSPERMHERVLNAIESQADLRSPL